jgi:RNA polymerase sigma-70 factor (ECF subfamily)
VTSAESQRELAGLLLDLPWEMRTAVVLKHVVGLSYAEIADALDRPSGTVRSDVSRGLSRLRTLLEEE